MSDTLIDPDCRDGKCGSCVGGPCECRCHDAAPVADPDDREIVEDGFGGRWVKHGPDCDLQVVRPGKVQCNCDDPRPLTMMQAAGVDDAPERTPPDDTRRLSIADLTGPEIRDLFRELDENYRLASVAFHANDMQAWVEYAGRGAELFEHFARLNGWREGRS